MIIKAYAVSHKLSIFNVMKMVKSGKLQSEIVEENGKDVTYILMNDEIEEEVKRKTVNLEQKIEAPLEAQVKALYDEIKVLRDEIEILKKQLLKG